MVDVFDWGSCCLAVLPWCSHPLISWAPRCPGCLSTARPGEPTTGLALPPWNLRGPRKKLLSPAPLGGPTGEGCFPKHLACDKVECNLHVATVQGPGYTPLMSCGINKNWGRGKVCTSRGGGECTRLPLTSSLPMPPLILGSPTGR